MLPDDMPVMMHLEGVVRKQEILLVCVFFIVMWIWIEWDIQNQKVCLITHWINEVEREEENHSNNRQLTHFYNSYVQFLNVTLLNISLYPNFLECVVKIMKTIYMYIYKTL